MSKRGGIVQNQREKKKVLGKLPKINDVQALLKVGMRAKATNVEKLKRRGGLIRPYS